MNTENEKYKFGLSTFDEPSQQAFNNKKERNREDLPKIPFLRLKNGKNPLRIITDPYKFYAVRFKVPGEKGFGKWVRVSGSPENDPAVKIMGLKALKERWLVGVIDRSENQIKLFEIGSQVYNKLKAMKDDIQIGDPKEREISVSMDKKAGPAKFYDTMHYDRAPLSESDLALISELGDSLEKVLERNSLPLRTETVLSRIKEMGFKGDIPEGPATDDGISPSGDVDLEDSDDDDYDFSAPQANA